MRSPHHERMKMKTGLLEMAIAMVALFFSFVLVLTSFNIVGWL
jgi:hypothetical protein